MSQISGEQIQEQAKVISQVHRQLAADFHPALKHVAAAGVIYQKTQEANQKALHDYLLTLNQLVDSAKEAEEQTQESVQQLKAIIPIIKKFNDQQAQLITEFSEITRKVHANAEGEKDSHRKMLNSYLKEQRQIHKEVEKKRKTQKDLFEFYEQKKLEAIRLQFLRYKFFTEKHTGLVKNFLNISLEVNDELAPIFGIEPKTMEGGRSRHSTLPNAMGQKYESVVSAESVREIPSGIPSPVMPRSVGGLNRIVADRNTSSQYEGTISNFLKEIGKEEADSPISNRASFVQPPPPPPPPIIPRTISLDTSDNIPPYPEVNPLAPIYRPPTPQPIRQLPIIPPADFEPVKPLPRPERRLPDANIVKPLPPPTHNHYQPERPVTILPNPSVQPPPPVIQPRKEKPLYTAADYGSILVCTMPYTAKTDRQLSLNINEQVELIRSGERGWVLVRTSGQKLGWFPAKFVRKAASEEIDRQKFE